MLARYMQILSPATVERFDGKAVRHPPLVPAELQGRPAVPTSLRPRRQAHRRDGTLRHRPTSTKARSSNRRWHGSTTAHLPEELRSMGRDIRVPGSGSAPSSGTGAPSHVERGPYRCLPLRDVNACSSSPVSMAILIEIAPVAARPPVTSKKYTTATYPLSMPCLGPSRATPSLRRVDSRGNQRRTESERWAARNRAPRTLSQCQAVGPDRPCTRWRTQACQRGSLQVHPIGRVPRARRSPRRRLRRCGKRGRHDSLLSRRRKPHR